MEMDQVALRSNRKVPMEHLKDSVLTMISESQQFDLLLNEMVSVHQEKAATTSHSIGGNLGDICNLSIVRDKALLPNTNSGYHVTERCFSKIMNIVKASNTQILTESQKVDIQSVLAIICQLCSDGSFHKSHFTSLLSQDGNIPLPLVWMLHVEGLVMLESFLSWNHGIDKIVAGIQQFMVTECVAGFLTELMSLGYAESRATDVSVKKLAIAVLEKLVLDLIDEPVQPSGCDTHPLVLAFSRVGVDMDIMKKVCSHLVTVVLSHKPLLKVSQAIRQQSEWSYSKTAKGIVQFYKQILLPFELRDVLQLLRRVLERQEVNWQLLLSFVSAIIVCLADAPTVFLEFTDELLRDGLSDCDFETTIMGMLLVRQACLQGPHVFMSYADWYQRTFSDSSKSLANNRKSFTFLIKFLTDLVPYESAQNIKVHILRPPFVPAKWRQLLTDYIVLAKTRLADLKESLDDQVQRDGVSKSGDPNQVAMQACSDVEKAVSGFSSSGKVPSFIMEASIFRKPYYVGQFLPALLKPRPRPDIPDVKIKLIEMLRKADKIPATMYSNYDKACKREAAQLTEGVFLDLHSDEEMDLDPWEQLDSSLRQLTAAVTNLCSEKDKLPSKCSVTEAVSLVCERLGTVLSASPDRDTDKEPVLVLDIDHPGIPTHHLQVIDKLLSTISSGLQATFSSVNPQFSWLTSVLTGVTQYGGLYSSLCCRIWTLVVKQGLQLEGHHIDSLAAILVELRLLGDRLPQIRLSGSSVECEDIEDLAATVIGHIPIFEGKWMSFSLRLISAFLKFGYSSHAEEENLFVFPSLVKKFAYLGPRLVAELRAEQHVPHDTESPIVIALYRSPIVQTLIQNVKFPLADWVRFEVNVNPQYDILTDFERHTYYSWVMYQHYLPMSRREGDLGGDYTAVATHLLQGIIRHDLRLSTTSLTCAKCDASSHERDTNRGQMINLLHASIAVFASSVDPDEPARNEPSHQDLHFEITQLFPYCDGKVAAEVRDGLPWLPGQLKVMLSSSKNDLEKQAVVGAFFRVSVHLPSYLLYRDTQTTPTVDHGVEAVVQLLNTVLVDHVCEGVLLPVPISIYLLQGLLSAGRPPAQNTLILDSVCQKCPVVAIACVAHYAAVGHIVELHCRGTTPSVEAVTGWVRGDHRNPPPGEAWLCSVAIFSHCRDQQSLETILPQTQRCTDKDTFKQILIDLIHLLVIQLSYCFFYSSPKDVRYLSDLPTTIQRILRLHGSPIIGHMLQGQVGVTTRMAVPRKYSDIQHLTLMRVLSGSVDENVCGTIASGHLDDLLNLFSKVCRTFEMVQPETDGSVGQPLTLDDVVSYSKFVKTIILQAQPEVIQNVSESLLRECGPDILHAAQRRIQSCLRGT